MKIPKAPKVPSASTLQSANLVKASPSNRAPPLPDDRAVTLDDLRQRAQAVSSDTRELAFMALDDEQRMEYGRAVDTALVVPAATRFAAGAYTTFERLSDADRAKVVGACPAFVDLLVHETVALQTQKVSFDAQAAKGEVNRASHRARPDAHARRTGHAQRLTAPLLPKRPLAVRDLARPHPALPRAPSP